MFLRRFFHYCLPPRIFLSIFGAQSSLGLMYWHWWNTNKTKLIKWHETELEKLDSGYKIAQAQKRMMADRDAFRARGGNSGDPAYPRIWDYVLFPFNKDKDKQ